MSERRFQHVTTPVVVVRIKETQVMGDTLAEALRDEFLMVYLPSGATNVVIDFQMVTYLSSAGFRPLLSLNRQVRERGGRLVLCNLSKEVEEIFAVTRLISSSKSLPATFEVQKDVPAAVAALYASQAPPASEETKQ
jgi:anti-anti-sigma factor